MLNQPLTRKEVLLDGLRLDVQRGLEIGPLNNPLATRAEARIEYLDHLDTPGLRAKYKDDVNVVIDDIVDVDHVYDGRRLAEIVGPEKKYDYVLASHVIEHVPDVLGWLGQIAELLTEGGTLRLAIPDRRFTFDYLRRVSELSDVVTAYALGGSVPAPIQIADFILNFRTIPLDRAWAGTLDPEPTTVDRVTSAVELARDSANNGNYHDVHCWVFTPISFAQLMGQCVTLGLTSFGCRRFVPTQQNTLEFYVIAETMPSREDAVASWAAMAEELAALGDSLQEPNKDRARLLAMENELVGMRRKQQIIEQSGSYRLARQISRPVRVFKENRHLGRPLRAIRERSALGR